MPVQSTEHDTFALIRIAKDGDEQALNALFARYQKKVLRIVRLRLNSGMREKLRLQSMDIVQEVFLHALKSLAGFQPKSEGSFVHWLSKIVENVIHDQLNLVSAKKRASAGEYSLDQTITVSEGKLRLGDFIAQDGTSPTQYVLKRDIQTLVDDLLFELDERDREVIIQHKLEGLTFREMASDAGKSEDAVRKQFNRSFGKLVFLAENNNVLQELRF
ncbi:MAG: RNA polymerase sigma factor [Syntrophobacteraceae bacterium]